MTELRHAVRRLARTPVFALAAALTLSLAIGANTTVFALLNGVVLNPLPFPESNRLIALEHGSDVIRVASASASRRGSITSSPERARSTGSRSTAVAAARWLVAWISARRAAGINPADALRAE